MICSFLLLNFCESVWAVVKALLCGDFRGFLRKLETGKLRLLILLSKRYPAAISVDFLEIGDAKSTETM